MKPVLDRQVGMMKSVRQEFGLQKNFQHSGVICGVRPLPEGDEGAPKAHLHTRKPLEING